MMPILTCGYEMMRRRLEGTRLWPRAGEKPKLRDYVEAHPVFNSAHARRMANRGANLCLWENSRGKLVAVAEFSWSSPTELHLRHKYAPEAGIPVEGELIVAIHYEGSQENNKRPLMRCPRCGLHRSALVLVQGHWYCRRCHGLDYRSNKIGSAVRRAEKYARVAAELQAMIRNFRRPDMIVKKRREVAALFEEAGPLPHPVANSDYNDRLIMTWASAEYDEIELPI